MILANSNLLSITPYQGTMLVIRRFICEYKILPYNNLMTDWEPTGNWFEPSWELLVTGWKLVKNRFGTGQELIHNRSGRD